MLLQTGFDAVSLPRFDFWLSLASRMGTYIHTPLHTPTGHMYAIHVLALHETHYIYIYTAFSSATLYLHIRVRQNCVCTSVRLSV